MIQNAALGHVTPARLSQFMKLLLLAPDIQEAILFLAPTTRGRIESREPNSAEQTTRRTEFAMQGKLHFLSTFPNGMDCSIGFSQVEFLADRNTCGKSTN
ncbi:MAG: hypothetical protein L0211_22760 [Planctomycetaceae bacterium]|nr:hypothetical protein [Planctomycetaceae bacterium]